MPEIPLYNGGMQRPLEAPPGPVLDRERRPRVDSSGTIQGIQRVKQGMAGLADASMQPLLPPDLGAGESRGVQALAAGIQNFGQALNEIGMRRLEAKNYADLAEAENAMDMEYAAFEKWRSQNLGNPDAWEPEWQRRLEGLGKTLTSNKAYSPFVQERLGVSLQKFGGGSSIRVATEATNATLRRGAVAAEAKFEIAKGNRDRPGMIQARAEHKQFTGEPDEVEALRVQEAFQELDAQDRDNFLSENPREYISSLRLPKEERPEFMRDMSEAEEVQGEYKAIANIEHGRAAATALYQADISSEKLRDPNDVWRKRAEYDPRGMLTDDDIENIMNLVASPEPNDPGYFEQMHLSISKYSAKNDPSGAQRAMMSTTIGQRFKGPMEQELQAQLKEQTERTEATGLDALDGEFTRSLNELNTMFDDGEFGQFKIPAANISYDHKSGSWVRARDPWEPAGSPIPIRISEENARKLTAGAFNDKDGKVKADVLIDDINARDEAARKLQMRRTLLQKRRAEGKYETPTGMLDEFRSSIESPTKDAAREKLPTWDTVPGNPLLPLPPEEERNSLLNKYAPAR